MKSSSHEKLQQLLNTMNSLDYVHPEDIPNIDLYMDQVLTFLDSQLGAIKDATDEKPMTKTMINNYSKNQILPPPEKKKYSRDHMLNLIFIYYLKNFLSMKDIKEILDPINKKYFGTKNGTDFYEIYKEVVCMENTVAQSCIKDIVKKYNLSREYFTAENDEDKEDLQDFSFICLLSFDVFMKKMLIEQFLEEQTSDSENTDDKKSV